MKGRVAYKWRSEVTLFVLKESKSMKVKISENNLQKTFFESHYWN